MAKGGRQRAPKRAKRDAPEHAEPQEVDQYAEDVPADEPEWVHSTDAQTPFGLVPPPVQSYLKEVNTRLVQLSQSASEEEEMDMLMRAALNEIDGKELALATDPNCSLVMENLSRHASTKALRILLDRISGNVYVLATHRFGSHVLQALLFSAQHKLDHDAGGGAAQDTDQGVLRTLPQLVHDVFAELEPHMISMMSDAFATHVLESLVGVLTGAPLEGAGELRSRRSAKYRAKGQQRSAVDASSGAAHVSNEPTRVPEDFFPLVLRLYTGIKEGISTAQLRSFASDKSAAPCLSLLLRLESGLTDRHGSLAWKHDSLTAAVLDEAEEEATRSDFIEAALRDAVASHVLESALLGASEDSVLRFWRVYVRGRVAKLGAHPCGNYVVAALIRLLPGGSDSPLAAALEELTQAGDQLVKNRMLGVLQASVERSAQLNACTDSAMRAVLSAFRFPSAEEDAEAAAAFVPAVLSLLTYKAYLHTRDAPHEDGHAKARKTRKRGSEHSEGAETVQGSVLLQRIALLPSTCVEPLFASLTADPEALAKWCETPVAVHVVLASLATRSASFAQRKRLLSMLLPMLLRLCDGVWGSRVADAVWENADGFTKVRY